MTSGTTKVDKTTISEEDEVAAVGHGVTVDLGLDVDTIFGVGLQPGNVDLNVKVANAVRTVRPCFKAGQVL